MELSSVLEILQVDIVASVTQERDFIPIPSGDDCRFQSQRPKMSIKNFKNELRSIPKMLKVHIVVLSVRYSRMIYHPHN